MKNNLYFTYEELNIIDVAIRNRMKNNSVKGIESYQNRCKKILAKVRTEMKKWE